jgi:hypothetical protein
MIAIKILYFLGDISMISFILLLMYALEKDKPLIKLFLPAALFKIFAGISLGIVYQYYYGGGDTFNFFYDSTAISSLLMVEPLLYLKGVFLNKFPTAVAEALIYHDHPRALLMSKLISPFNIITWNNYFSISAYLSLFSFIGMWKLANRLSIYFPSTKKAAAMAYLFFPSVVFWSSGVMKESIIMGIIGFLGSAFLKIYYGNPRPKWYKTGLYLAGIILLLLMKYYYAAILLPIVLTALTTQRISERNAFLSARFSNQVVLWLMIFSALGLFATHFHPNLGVGAFLEAIVKNHEIIVSASNSQSLIYFNNIEPTFYSIFINIPTALLAGLFRPLFWDWGSIFQILTGIENVVVVVLFSFAIAGAKKFYILEDSEKILIFSVVVYILIMAILMAFASPNFGSLMRYKVGFLPFFIYLILISKPLTPIEDEQPVKVEERKVAMN